MYAILQINKHCVSTMAHYTLVRLQVWYIPLIFIVICVVHYSEDPVRSVVVYLGCS